MKKTGFILLDKIDGETSFKALFPLKRAFSTKRVGHAGTLDLKASGLIIAAIGRATRLLSFVEAKDKCYTFRLHLGFETDTSEWDGEVLYQDKRIYSEFYEQSNKKSNGNSIKEALEEILPQFLGVQMQVPPKYSAVKIGGIRASDLTERGENIELSPRKIEIHNLKIIDEGKRTAGTSGKEFATFDFYCECSKGTYIRSLGRDLARALNTYGSVSQIRRIRIGDVSVENAIKGTEITENCLMPVNSILNYPIIILNEKEVGAIRNGNWILWRNLISGLGSDGLVFVENSSHEILSLCVYENGRIKPKIYLAE